MDTSTSISCDAAQAAQASKDQSLNIGSGQRFLVCKAAGAGAEKVPVQRLNVHSGHHNGPGCQRPDNTALGEQAAICASCGNASLAQRDVRKVE